MRKYVFYAIGEIALVVIGILLALQINLWNENRVLKKEEYTYLLSLQRDVGTMIQEFENHGEGLLQEKNAAIQALRSLENCMLDSNSRQNLNDVLEGHQSLGLPGPKRAAYDEMLATGTFARMQNDSLKTAITDLYAGLAEGGDRLNYFRDELGRASQIIMK